MALYLFTLAPSITQRHFGVDGAELATAAYTLGVAHPPGYPTYLILAKVFSLLLPWGDIAHRTGVLSALSSAGATVLVYYISYLLIEGTARNASPPSRMALAAASMAAVSFAVSPLLWSQSVMTEVYSLNALFTGGVTLLAILWGKGARGGSWLLLASAFLLGLGLGNHLTLAFLILPLAYYLLLHRERLTPRLVAGFLGLLILGLSVYIYLPLRASHNPPINWGDASTLEGFVWTVSAMPYRDLAFGLPRHALANLPERWVEWADLLVRQFNAVGLFLGILGAWRLRVSSSPLLVFTGLLFLSSLAYSLTYYTADAQVYLLPAFLVFSLWIGVGLHWLLYVAAMSREMGRGLPFLPPLALAAAAFLVVPALQLTLNFQGISLRDDRESLAYAQGIFQRVEPDAVIIADTEQELFPLWYYSYVIENGRGPVVLSSRLSQFDWYLRGQHERNPEMVPAEVTGDYWRRLARVVEHNLGKRPVYITAGASFLLGQFEGEEEDGLYRLIRPKT
ncbi:MAG: hypothetical protein HW388_972 [Dehalococcoidia bacterium]|nr:hypothetical protein [Dehalococcoidia bacterium]